MFLTKSISISSKTKVFGNWDWWENTSGEILDFTLGTQGLVLKMK